MQKKNKAKIIFLNSIRIKTWKKWQKYEKCKKKQSNFPTFIFLNSITNYKLGNGIKRWKYKKSAKISV
jgi:hypothetical protein